MLRNFLATSRGPGLMPLVVCCTIVGMVGPFCDNAVSIELSPVLTIDTSGQNAREEFRAREFTSTVQDSLMPYPLWQSNWFVSSSRSADMKTETIGYRAIGDMRWESLKVGESGVRMVMPALGGTAVVVDRHAAEANVVLNESLLYTPAPSKAGSLEYSIGRRSPSGDYVALVAPSGVEIYRRSSSAVTQLPITGVSFACLSPRVPPAVALLQTREDDQGLWLRITVAEADGRYIYEEEWSRHWCPHLLFDASGRYVIINRIDPTDRRLYTYVVDLTKGLRVFEADSLPMGTYFVSPRNGSLLVISGQEEQSDTTRLRVFSLTVAPPRLIWDEIVEGTMVEGSVTDDAASTVVRRQLSSGESVLAVYDNRGQLVASAQEAGIGVRGIGFVDSAFIVSGVLTEGRELSPLVATGTKIFVYKLK